MKTIAAALLASVTLFACSAPVGEAPAEPAPDTTSEDLSASSIDATLIANAEAFFEAKLASHGRTPYEIPYAQLPPSVARVVIKYNPNPKDSWAAIAYSARLENAKGARVRVYFVTDGIDDEGETDTLYSATGRELAVGNSYQRPLGWDTITK
jgi:hypothetical protein